MVEADGEADPVDAADTPGGPLYSWNLMILFGVFGVDGAANPTYVDAVDPGVVDDVFGALVCVVGVDDDEDLRDDLPLVIDFPGLWTHVGEPEPEVDTADVGGGG